MLAVLVVDRELLLAHRLLSLPCADRLVCAVRDIFSAFRWLRRRRFDVVLVRSCDGDAYGIALSKWVRLHHVNVPVVVVAEDESTHAGRVPNRFGTDIITAGTCSAEELHHIIDRTATRRRRVRSFPTIPAKRIEW